MILNKEGVYESIVRAKLVNWSDDLARMGPDFAKALHVFFYLKSFTVGGNIHNWKAKEVTLAKSIKFAKIDVKGEEIAFQDCSVYTLRKCRNLLIKEGLASWENNETNLRLRSWKKLSDFVINSEKKEGITQCINEDKSFKIRRVLQINLLPFYQIAFSYKAFQDNYVAQKFAYSQKVKSSFLPAKGIEGTNHRGTTAKFRGSLYSTKTGRKIDKRYTQLLKEDLSKKLDCTTQTRFLKKKISNVNLIGNRFEENPDITLSRAGIQRLFGIKSHQNAIRLVRELKFIKMIKDTARKIEIDSAASLVDFWKCVDWLDVKSPGQVDKLSYNYYTETRTKKSLQDLPADKQHEGFTQRTFYKQSNLIDLEAKDINCHILKLIRISPI